jgi:hypothetical protein
MSPTPAVTHPLANQLSVSHPVDMHAHAIITAPMTNTNSEPIANLRIQGIVSSDSRSAQLLLKLGYGRLHQLVGRYLYLLVLESRVIILASAFQFEIGIRFRCRQHEMDCSVFTVGLKVMFEVA